MLITFLLCSLVSLSNTINPRNLTSTKKTSKMRWNGRKKKNIFSNFPLQEFLMKINLIEMEIIYTWYTFSTLFLDYSTVAAFS